MGDSLLTARGPGATVSVLRGPSVLADLGDELDDLLAATGAPIPARRPWLQAWVDAFTDHGPWAVVVRSPDRLEGVALLATRVRRGVTEVVRLGNGGGG